MSMKSFAKTDLLSYDDFDAILNSLSPHEKSKLIGCKLASYCVIKNNCLYLLQENDTYGICNTKIENQLLCIVSEYMYHSLTIMKKESKSTLQTRYSKTFPKMLNTCSLHPPKIYVFSQSSLWLGSRFLTPLRLSPRITPEPLPRHSS